MMMCKSNAYLALLSVVLSPAIKVLAQTACTEDDFLASGFEFTNTIENTTYSGNYTGCYEEAATNDDDLELIVYNRNGNLTLGGATFYASDNNGGYDQPVWFFNDVQAGSTVDDLTQGFLCFDLDENDASETHPADVTNWGVIPDDTSTSTTTSLCEIVMTCGCTVADDDDDEVVAEEDDDSPDTETTDGASSLVGGSYVVTIASSLAAAVLVAAHL